MGIAHSVSGTSFGTPDTRKRSRPPFSAEPVHKQSAVPLRPSMRRDEASAQVTLSSEGLVRAKNDNALIIEATQNDRPLSDLVRWIVVVGLGVIMGWSAAGAFLS